MRVKVSVDNQSYLEKPETLIPKIKRRTASLWQEIEIEELGNLVGNKGHAMIPAKLEEGISAKNCMGMQIFALDFDEGITFQEVMEKCKRYHIPISFAYHTYSSSKSEERFRVVFTYSTMIEDSFSAKIILAILHKIFPESDSACKNLDRLFLGGKKLIYMDKDAHIALVYLLPALYEVFSKKRK